MLRVVRHDVVATLVGEALVGKSGHDASLGVFESATDGFVAGLGALFRDEAEAFLVNVLHVVPPHGLLALSLERRVQAVLTKIFKQNVLAQNVVGEGLGMVGSTVLAIAEALFLLEIVSAHGAGPGDKSRYEVNVVLQLVDVLVKFFDEVKSQSVVR